jgi:two-component system, NtrC family, nitrogen regulation sensor histidine kinase NtrY
VTLRRRFVLYLLVLHLLFAGLAVLLLLRNRLWLLAVEVVFAVSLAFGLGLVRHFFGTLSILQSGAQLLNESDFQARFRETGRPEMDELVHVYNRMADHLREERVRLQEQHHLLSLILAASPSGMAILDFDGRFEFVNGAAERLLGQPAAVLRGRTPAEVDSPLARALVAIPAGHARVVALWGGRRVKCHKGTFVDRGFPRTFILIEELTEELRQFEKAAYEKLIRMLSHEVNNSVGATNSLLHSCLNYAPQIREEDRHDFETALRVVIERTEQLSAFMRGFADVVRLPPPRTQPCDVRELLDSIAVLMRPLCREREVEWRWELADGFPRVDMDRAQMEQVLVNVCKNALEAIGRQGSLTVRIGRKGTRPFVAIEDSGPGIPDDVRAHLFTPFFSTKENGQGLGLTLVQEILDRHRFEYSLEGPPGGPTTFTILF